MRTTIKY